MNDYLLYLFIGIVGAWTGKEYSQKEQNKKEKKFSPCKFKININDMIEMDLSIYHINQFTAKINAIVEIEEIGFSKNGKLILNDK